MNCWFTENQSAGLRISCRVRVMLHREESPFQEIAVYDTDQFGRLLALDDVIMTTTADEFIYHEMMAHVPLITHPDPKRVLIVGGGDGGVVREVIKHPVAMVHLVEIDGRVIEVSKTFFPTISSGLRDPRVKVIIADGIEHVRKSAGLYDVIIVDSTDPVGPAVGLFEEGFYRSVHDALAGDGLFVAQTESPFFNGDLIGRLQGTLRKIFPSVFLYLASIPTYPGGLWTISMGSKKHHPDRFQADRAAGLSTRYYSADVHRAAFALPPFVRELLAGAPASGS